MQYSPDNSSGLLSLVEALRSGLDPEIGYQLMSGIETDQAAQVAQRQERLSGLADLLMGAAQGGMPYEGATAMAEAAPGPAGPAVQNMLSSLYPGGGEAPQAMPGDPGYLASITGEGAPQTSPLFMSPENDPMAALELATAQTGLDTAQLQNEAMSQELQAAPDPANEAWAAFGQSMIDAGAQGMDSTTAYRTFIMTNPSARPFLNAEPNRVHSILQQVFHPEG